MPIQFKKNLAVFRNEVCVEEAEELLAWLDKNPTANADLAALGSLHTANLQVLMAAKTVISTWPKDAELRAWLQPALNPAG